MLANLDTAVGTFMIVAVLIQLGLVASIYLIPRAPGRCRVVWLVCTLLGGPVGYAVYWRLRTPHS